MYRAYSFSSRSEFGIERLSDDELALVDEEDVGCEARTFTDFASAKRWLIANRIMWRDSFAASVHEARAIKKADVDAACTTNTAKE